MHRVTHLLLSITESDQFTTYGAVFAVKEKQSLDEADANLNLVQVTILFGSCIKYVHVVKMQYVTCVVIIPFFNIQRKSMVGRL